MPPITKAPRPKPMPMVFSEQRAGASQLPPGASGGGVSTATAAGPTPLEPETGCANEVNEVEHSKTQASAAFENSLLMALNTPTEKIIFEIYLQDK